MDAEMWVSLFIFLNFEYLEIYCVWHDMRQTKWISRKLECLPFAWFLRFDELTMKFAVIMCPQPIIVSANKTVKQEPVHFVCTSQRVLVGAYWHHVSWSHGPLLAPDEIRYFFPEIKSFLIYLMPSLRLVYRFSRRPLAKPSTKGTLNDAYKKVSYPREIPVVNCALLQFLNWDTTGTDG